MRNLLAALNRVLNHSWFVVFSIVLLTAIYTTKADRNFGWTKAHREDKTPIFNDGAGYYAWMPKWFIYGGKSDFLFLNDITKKYPGKNFASTIAWPDGKNSYNKYYTGVAVAASPFFGLGHVTAKICDVPRDGYSWPYQLFIVLSGIFYFLAGLSAIALLLRRFGIANCWIVVSLCILAFGTNLGYYVYEYAPYSHVYSFAFCALFVLFAKIWSDNRNPRTLLLLAALAGMIFIIRPTNTFIVLLVPFLFSSLSSFVNEVKQLLRKKLAIVGVSLLIFGASVFFQLWNNYTQNGNWTLNTYFLESFEYLADPKIVEVLFGFRKGLFVYAPALLLFLPGMFVLFRRNRQLFYGTLFLFIVFTYVTAAWWCWWYGGGLGMRPMFDILVLFTLPVAFLFQYASLWLRVVLLLFAGLAIKLSLVYEFQIRNNILHYENMDYAKFKRVFLHTEPRFVWTTFLEYDELPENFDARGAAVAFTYGGRKMHSGQQVSVNSDDLNATPLLTYVPEKTGEPFGGRIRAELKIFSQEENPGFRAYYYSRGEVVKENSYSAGGFIPAVDEFASVSFDVFPGLRTTEFDSLRLYYFRFRDSAVLKNVVFQPYRPVRKFMGRRM